MEQEQINLNELAEKMEFLINEVGLLKDKFDEEMEFIKCTEEAWQSYDRDEFIKRISLFQKTVANL